MSQLARTITRVERASSAASHAAGRCQQAAQTSLPANPFRRGERLFSMHEASPIRISTGAPAEARITRRETWPQS